MARQKKFFNYEFVDGVQEIPSSYKAKCNITGELIPIYHKFLVKLILDHYKNNFALFKNTFVKKGAAKQQRVDQGYGDEDTVDPYKLNIYSDYLVASYKHCIDILKDNYNQKVISKTKSEMSHIDECFTRRFNRNIAKFV